MDLLSEFPEREFTTTKILHSSRISMVSVVVNRKQEQYVLKETFLSNKLKENMLNELSIHMFLKDYNLYNNMILPVLGIYKKSGTICYIMPLMEGDLTTFIGKEELPFGDYIAIIQRILEITKYLRQIGLIHNDIKPDNFLFDNSNNIVIADLNCAYLVNHPPKEVCGTLGYFSPEYYCKDGNKSLKQLCKSNGVIPLLDYQNDIWQVGVLFYFFMFRKLPFGHTPTPKHVSDVVRADYSKTSPFFREVVKSAEKKGDFTDKEIDNYVTLLLDFISRMLRPSRIARESPSSLLKHNIFKEDRVLD